MFHKFCNSEILSLDGSFMNGKGLIKEHSNTSFRNVTITRYWSSYLLIFLCLNYHIVLQLSFRKIYFWFSFPKCLGSGLQCINKNYMYIYTSLLFLDLFAYVNDKTCMQDLRYEKIRGLNDLTSIKWKIFCDFFFIFLWKDEIWCIRVYEKSVFKI